MLVDSRKMNKLANLFKERKNGSPSASPAVTPPKSHGSPENSSEESAGLPLSPNSLSSVELYPVKSISAADLTFALEDLRPLTSAPNSLHGDATPNTEEHGALEPSAKAGGRFLISADHKFHQHRLKSLKRQERLRKVIAGLLKIKADHHDAVSVVTADKQLSMMSRLIDQMDRRGSPSEGSECFNKRYGKCENIIGRGSFGTVRLCQKYDATTAREVLYAVKEFKLKDQNPKTISKLTSEFCISSALHHPNIVLTLDLLKDSKGYFSVMEYCPGGDLYTLILSSPNGLDVYEANCFFKQMLRGVRYMHDMGVAHMDLKPENLLLTPDGALKISDFGSAFCFRMAWERNVHLCNSLQGSEPYIAPEEYKDTPFDPRKADVWAAGVIYMAMRTGHYMWNSARRSDEYYRNYVAARRTEAGYSVIEALRGKRVRNVVYSMLDPVPERRLTVKDVLRSEWVRDIHVCDAGRGKQQWK